MQVTTDLYQTSYVVIIIRIQHHCSVGGGQNVVLEVVVLHVHSAVYISSRDSNIIFSSNVDERIAITSVSGIDQQSAITSIILSVLNRQVAVASLIQFLRNCSIKSNIRITEIGTDVDINLTSATVPCIVSAKQKITARIINFNVVKIIESSVSSGCSKLLIKFKILNGVTVSETNTIVLQLQVINTTFCNLYITTLDAVSRIPCSYIKVFLGEGCKTLLRSQSRSEISPRSCITGVCVCRFTAASVNRKDSLIQAIIRVLDLIISNVCSSIIIDRCQSTFSCSRDRCSLGIGQTTISVNSKLSSVNGLVNRTRFSNRSFWLIQRYRTSRVVRSNHNRSISKTDQGVCCLCITIRDDQLTRLTCNVSGNKSTSTTTCNETNSCETCQCCQFGVNDLSVSNTIPCQRRWVGTRDHTTTRVNGQLCIDTSSG